MRYILFLIAIFTMVGCTKKATQLSEIEEIRNVFTESEIGDLELLFDFFNKSICRDADENLDNCYYNFFEKVKNSADSGSLYLHIPIKDQLAVYEEFSDSTFYQIWAFGKTSNEENPNDILGSVYYKWDGKFFKFLKKFAPKNEFAKSYLESVEATGSPGPSLIAGITYNYKNFEIEELSVKFIIAIHFLTLNDEYKREENNEHKSDPNE